MKCQISYYPYVYYIILTSDHTLILILPLQLSYSFNHGSQNAASDLVHDDSSIHHPRRVLLNPLQIASLLNLFRLPHSCNPLLSHNIQAPKSAEVPSSEMWIGRFSSQPPPTSK